MADRPTFLTQKALAPATTLGDVAILCNPQTPLDPEGDSTLIEDLRPIRGGDRLAPIVRNIRRSKDTPTIHLLTGHFGAGKTTELLSVRQRLAVKDADGAPLEVLYVDADTLLDKTNVDLEDILVAIWKEVYERSHPAARKVLNAVWTGQIKGALTGAVTNLVPQLTESLGGLSTMLKLSNPEQRKQLRLAVSPLLNQLINGLNDAFWAIEQEPGSDGRNTAILIDNLEKLSPTDAASVERLYLERLLSLKQLRAHLVITVPVFIAYARAGGSLPGLYGTDVVALPMIKVEERQEDGGGPYEPGIEAMVELLSKRVNFDPLFSEGKVAARRIARVSGGCIRDALRIVAGAANQVERPPVPTEAVDRAIAVARSAYELSLPEAWISLLKEIQAGNQFPVAVGDDVKREMLRYLYVLQYQNGDPRPWHAVHPLVRECGKYAEWKG